MHDGYAELCNITHPAADSVLYLRERGSDGSIAFCTTADEEAIVELCERGGTVFAYALSESLKYPVMILKIVNPFQPEKQRKRLLKGDCALLLNQDQLLERLDVAVGPFAACIALFRPMSWAPDNCTTFEPSRIHLILNLDLTTPEA